MNNMLGYLRDYKRESVLAPLFKMLEATFDLFVPLVMADIVNVGIAAHDLHYILVRCGIRSEECPGNRTQNRSFSDPAYFILSG